VNTPQPTAACATLDRRQLLRQFAASTTAVLVAAGAVPAAQDPPAPRLQLGIDNFAVRAMQWKAPDLIQYAADLKVDSLFITDLDALERLDNDYLGSLRSRAADSGLRIQLGTWSICPSSKVFKNKWGTAEEHLATGLRAAHALGSPVLRVVLGAGEDRQSPGGITARIADTVAVCRAQRSLALDLGVKVAVENHAGDLQSRELVQLIEQAGREFVGANFDSGNALWTLEDPLASLETLGPYVLTTSLRDAAIWESENGATVQWTAMGEGQIDLRAFFTRFAQLCPQAPVHVETISGFNRELPYLRGEYWQQFPDYPARDFARFVALARRGRPRAPFAPPPGVERAKAEQEYQRGELARSIHYCRETLGLGLRQLGPARQ
jgi:sugar phosphate isomerase/epimerase